MANVVECVRYRSRLTKGEQYPLHYADLAQVLAGQAEGDVYLWVGFWDYELRRAKPRDGRPALVSLEYVSERPEWRYGTLPWDGVENPNVVSGTVNAVRHEALASAGLTRPRLREVLGDRLAVVAKGGLFGHRWRLSITLDPDKGVLECASAVWTGIREEPEVRVVVPVRAPEPA